MNVDDIFQFLYDELRSGVENHEHERILELGSLAEVLYEVAKMTKDRRSKNILDRLIHIVFHYRQAEEEQWIVSGFEEIGKLHRKRA